MKIIVTGALGHIGSRLVRELPRSFSGLEFVLVDNLSTQRYCSLFNLPSEAKYRFLEADVAAMDLSTVVKGADLLIHLAAHTDAAGSFERAAQVEQNNFWATKLVAESCAEHNVKLITLSSASVYGTKAARIDENCSEADLKPQSPYATTKLKEERLVQSLVQKDGLRASIFRFGTIFGTSPGMRFHTAVNKFCWQAATGQPITVWATAMEQSRPYLDLGDACDAISLIIRKEIFDGRVYNVLTRNFTVRQIIESIRAFVPGLEVTLVNNAIMNELTYEVVAERFQSLGFSPKGELSKAVGETLALLKGASSN